MKSSRRVVLAALMASAACRRRRRAIIDRSTSLPPGLPTMASCCPHLDVAIAGDTGDLRDRVALVYLHGYNRFPGEFLDRAQQFARRGVTTFLPAGPLMARSDRNRTGLGRAWWNFDQWWPGAIATGDEQGPDVETPPQLASARVGVQQLLREIHRRHHPRALVLAGFSQGAMLSLDVAAAANPPVDRVVAMSGALLCATLPALRSAHPARVPVLVTHGRKDSGLPLADGERIVATLRRHGHAASWRPFDGDHVLPPGDLFDEVARFVLG